MMNLAAYFREADRQESEMQACSQTRKEQVGPRRVPFERETLASGCVLFRLVETFSDPGPRRRSESTV